MYCRNCGKQIADQAVICVGCGCAPKNGVKFCQNCGGDTTPPQEVCTKCGVRLAVQTAAQTGDKDWLTALLLCFFLGCFGAHRFYTGHTGLAVLMLLTGGGCGIWWLVDFILLLVGSFKDSEGKPLARR